MMMMIGERNRLNPTIQIPDWNPLDDSTVVASPFSPMNSPSALDPVMALHHFLPSNESDFPNKEMDAFSCDHFRMFEFKVRMCARGRSHDWTECPYAHPGEKARRRDPVKYRYSGASCPDLRRGICKKGDSCEFAHGVFECWLHPARYRTQPCKDGIVCRRRVCFFAHSAEQLRVLPQQSPMVIGSTESFEGSPIRRAFEINMTKGYPSLSSPTSILNSPPLSPSDSPPMSPVSPEVGGGFGSPKSVYELLTSMRNLHVGNTKSSRQREKPSVSSLRSSTLRPAFCDSPTRTHILARSGESFCDFWDQALMEDPAMERVESGRDIRAQMYVKLSQENSLGSADPAPDIGWISELVK